MQMAYGAVDSQGSILNGSGNFSVAKTATGRFTVTMQGSSSTIPTVTTSVYDPYAAGAVVQITSTNGGSGSQPTFTAWTGHADQNSGVDIYVFSFIAVWD
jgi:hypothetical protein